MTFFPAAKVDFLVLLRVTEDESCIFRSEKEGEQRTPRGKGKRGCVPTINFHLKGPTPLVVRKKVRNLSNKGGDIPCVIINKGTWWVPLKKKEWNASRGRKIVVRGVIAGGVSSGFLENRQLFPDATGKGIRKRGKIESELLDPL